MKAKEFQRLLSFIVKALLDQGEEFRNCVEIVYAVFHHNKLPITIRQSGIVVKLISEGRYS